MSISSIPTSAGDDLAWLYVVGEFHRSTTASLAFDILLGSIPAETGSSGSDVLVCNHQPSCVWLSIYFQLWVTAETRIHLSVALASYEMSSSIGGQVPS